MSQTTSGNALIISLLATLSTITVTTHPSRPTTLAPPYIQQFLSSPQVKQLLLTLHCIFPDHLLPALDLLERQKVSCQALREDNATDKHGPGGTTADEREKFNSCYYVEASSQRGGRYSQLPAASPNYYEVRLLAWNCSCPAFTFAAVDGELSEEYGEKEAPGDCHGQALQYGGLAEGDRYPPMCKHLLACLLARSSPFLASGVKIMECTEQESAAWAAGWIT